MQGTMSKNLCEALRIMQIRSERRTLPRRSANLWSEMATLRWFEEESVYEISKSATISKRRYGIEIEGNPTFRFGRMKSNFDVCECLWLTGYKPSTSIEGARSEKMTGQNNETSHPELGCSGSLNPTVTVHLVNVGTPYFGRKTGLAAVDVKCGGRSSRSSQR